MTEIPPLTYAGLRYTLAFLVLLPFAFRKKIRSEIKNLGKKDLGKFILLGILFYSFTQGTQFIGLSLLPAVTVSLLQNFTPIIVSIMGVILLSEKPSARQWFGSILFVLGILVYFFPVNLPADEILGISVMSVGVLANSFSSVLGRNINRSHKFDPLTVTVITMGIGSVIMLMTGIMIQGLPLLSLKNILFLVWLAVVNTAFAFTIWNLTLRNLTAMESSIINGTMLIQIAVLAWIFLGEAITLAEGIGMAVAFAGALFVQVVKKN